VLPVATFIDPNEAFVIVAASIKGANTMRTNPAVEQQAFIFMHMKSQRLPV
jgi:hypothetical protein